jgi:hypothetical protein
MNLTKKLVINLQAKQDFKDPIEKKVRDGWAIGVKEIYEAGEDRLILGDFSNQADTDWIW